MPTTNNLQSPTEMPLVSPASEVAPTDMGSGDKEKVKMKKQLGLVEGTAIILGIIFGSGEVHSSFEHIFLQKNTFFQKSMRNSMKNSTKIWTKI